MAVFLSTDTSPRWLLQLARKDKFPLNKIGKICDFTAAGQRWLMEKGKKGKGKGTKGPPLRRPPRPGVLENEFLCRTGRAATRLMGSRIQPGSARTQSELS